MPRTAEHIAGCHEAAAALRAAGKPIWNKSVNIKAILHEDQSNETPEHIVDISLRIARLLRTSLPPSILDFMSDDYDCDLAEAIEAMEQCSLEEFALDKKNGFEAVDIFNDWLTVIYDWADVNRVWLG